MNFRIHLIICASAFLSIFFMGSKAASETQTDHSATIFDKAMSLFLSAKADSAQVYFEKALFSYSNTDNKRRELECAYFLSRMALDASKYDDVRRYAARVTQINDKFKLNHPLCFESQYFCGVALLKESKFDMAYQLFNELEPKITQFTIADSTLARFYGKKGASSYYKGDIFAALEAYSSAVTFGKKAFGEYSMFVCDQINNLGVMNFMLSRYDEALAYYLQAEQFQNTAKISDDLARADIYTNIGLIFKVKKDYESAIRFFEKARDLYLKNPEKEASTVAHMYLNVAGVYQEIGMYDKQFENIMKSKEYSEKYFPELLPRVYFQLAYYYECVKNIPMGYNAFKMAVQKARQLFGESADLAYAYNNLGEFCISNNYRFTEALPYINHALAYFSKTRGYKNPAIARNYLSLGEYFERSGSTEKALTYYHKAVTACVEDFSNEDVYSLPHHTNSLSDEHLIEALKAKASILKVLAAKTASKRFKYLHMDASFRHYMHIFRMFDKIRAGFISEESGFLLSANEQYIYNDALQLAHDIHTLTGNSYYAEQAFLIADKAHAANLQIMMQKKEFPEKFEFSDSSFIKEHELKKELNALNELILKEKTSKWRDSSKIAFWNEKVTAHTARLRQLRNIIIKKHPAYQHLMYVRQNAGLVKALRSNLTDSEAIVEYYFADSVLYSFCLLRNELKIQKQIVGAPFFEQLEDVLYFLHFPKYANSDSLVTLNYREAAYNLYRQLLEPFEALIKDKELILVPDYKLNNLPFGILLTHSTKGKWLNFKELPYLIRNNPVRYLYAARFSHADKRTSEKASILAFAPSYSAIKGNDEVINNLVDPLIYNEEEVETIVQSRKSRVYRSASAVETSFRKEASRYSIVHLAMHAIIDDENPSNSRLVFTNTPNSGEDNLLYSYETYNMELNTDLLVLSACKTGTGKMQKGEGMLSLTRGFIFAGVKSIVTSLWTVNDKSGSEFFGYFYNNLAQQQSKSNALRKASIDYIQSADNIRAHPYYWAGFVLIGSDNPVQFASSRVTVWVIIASSIVLLLFIWLLIKRKRRKLTSSYVSEG